MFASTAVDDILVNLPGGGLRVAAPTLQLESFDA